MPVLVARLAQPEIVETSEEIRLKLVQGLGSLVSSHFAPFVQETCGIISKTLADPFPDVKKESCKIIMKLCELNARQVALEGAAIVKALIPCLKHRHSNVRTVALQVQEIKTH